MTLSMTWGATTLPNPDEENGVTIEAAIIGSNQRMLSGTLRAEIIAEKARIVGKWEGLNATERNTLRGAYDAYNDTATTLTLPNSATYSVIAVSGWREIPWWNRAETPFYNVTITFDEV